jgi:phosphatidylserine/phosphatidylglycerophosphate/cardiolipin synthase-like enzyme
LNLDYHIAEAQNLEDYIAESRSKDWTGALVNIAARYESLTRAVVYSWFFCDGLMYSDIDDYVKGNSMEFDALIHNLRTLKGRLESFRGYGNIHINTCFSDLKKCIVEEIRRSEFTINIAVAWLSDNDICRELIDASQKGIDVKVIMIDCPSNRETALTKSRGGPDLVFVPEFGARGTNKMHNKFSTFDFTRVITGSYNWSNNANYNDENVVLIINDVVARRFALEFQRLWKQYRS